MKILRLKIRKKEKTFKNIRKYKKYKINFVRVGGANTVPDSQVRLHRALSFTCLLLQDPPDYAPSS